MAGAALARGGMLPSCSDRADTSAWRRQLVDDGNVDCTAFQACTRKWAGNDGTPRLPTAYGTDSFASKDNDAVFFMEQFFDCSVFNANSVVIDTVSDTERSVRCSSTSI